MSQNMSFNVFLLSLLLLLFLLLLLLLMLLLLFFIISISLSLLVVVSPILLCVLPHMRPLGYVIITWCQGIIIHRCYCAITIIIKMHCAHIYAGATTKKTRLETGQKVHCPTRMFLSHCQVHPLRTIVLLGSNHSHWLLFTISYLTFSFTLCFIDSSIDLSC